MLLTRYAVKAILDSLIGDDPGPLANGMLSLRQFIAGPSVTPPLVPADFTPAIVGDHPAIVLDDWQNPVYNEDGSYSCVTSPITVHDASAQAEVTFLGCYLTSTNVPDGIIAWIEYTPPVSLSDPDAALVMYARLSVSAEGTVSITLVAM